MRAAIDGWLTTEVRLFEALLAGVVLAALIWVLRAAVRSDGAVRRAMTAGTGASLRERLRAWTGVPLKTTAGTIFLIVFGTAYIALVLLGIVATFVLLGNVLLPDTDATGLPTSGPASLGLGALLVALLGAPFLVWRNRVAQETLDLGLRRQAQQDDAAFNDKINAAATDLAAQRQVTRVVTDEKGHEAVLTEWEDDLVTRMAAIDRLEALALEAIANEDFPPAQRIARMLSIYVRELSEVYTAEEMPEGVEDGEAIRAWASRLKPGRRDMERAAQSLGRINPEDDGLRERFDPRNIDLRLCNLQGCSLDSVVFSGGVLVGAHLQGASLQSAHLFAANMEDANLQATNLKLANLRRVHAHGARLDRANLQTADVRQAKLHEASLIGAYCSFARMEGVVLTRTELAFADFGHADLSGAMLGWVQLQSAYIKNTILRGALLSHVQVPENIRHRAYLNGSAFFKVDGQERLSPKALKSIVFSDGLQDFPRGLTFNLIEALQGVGGIVWPPRDFTTAWREWAAEHHPDVTIAPDWHRETD